MEVHEILITVVVIFNALEVLMMLSRKEKKAIKKLLEVCLRILSDVENNNVDKTKKGGGLT